MKRHDTTRQDTGTAIFCCSTRVEFIAVPEVQKLLKRIYFVRRGRQKEMEAARAGINGMRSSI
jgi:hypothetical protein